MRIESDFRDFYDIWASNKGPVLRRFAADSGPDKPEQFKILSAAGFFTPPHGTVGEVMRSWWEQENRRVDAVVAYTDTKAHCGEGKELWSRYRGELRTESRMGYDAGNEEVYRKLGVFCSAFCGCYLQMHPDHPSSYSIRRLQIGRRVIWLEYKSSESWMSNVGEGTCSVIGDDGDVGYNPLLPYPLHAIDFVVGNELYAIDLNISPGMRHSGVEELMSGQQVCDELERAVLFFEEK